MENDKYITTRKHYYSLDGFRALSCIGIMMMHIQANTHYQLSGFVWQQLIPSFTHLVLLFLMMSGFGTCVGYLEWIQNGTINLEKFYVHRYKKILPYFCFLIIVAVLYEPTVTNFFDATMEIMLIYGFLPNNALNIIGVGWTLGVIFVFYFVFPIFSVLIKTKKRAWGFLGVGLWINFVCYNHYFSDIFVTPLFAARHSFIWCLPLFVLGGIMYLYRNEISDLCTRFRYLFLGLCIGCTIVYYLLPPKVNGFEIIFYKNFILYSFWLFYGIGVDSKVLGNKVMAFLSDISLEIYLSHMFVFRFLEKFHMQYIFGEDTWLSYIVLCILTFTGLMALIFGYKFVIRILKRQLFHKIKKKMNNNFFC